MEVIYFGDEIAQRAPSLMGNFLIKFSDTWLKQGDIEAALAQGETVTIRPANAVENRFAGELVALYEVWEELATRRQLFFANVSSWLGDVDPAVVADRMAQIKDGE